MLRLIYLTSLLASVFAAIDPLHKRQGTATTSAQAQPTSLYAHITKLCYPAIYIWDYGSAEQKQAAGYDQFANIRDMILTLADSPFPCESSAALWGLCTTDGTEFLTPDEVSPVIVDEERSCICPSRYWALSDACLNCQRVHGYPAEWVTESKTFYDALEAEFCNATVPDTGLYGVESSLSELLPTLPRTGPPDAFPSQTEVSLYYTEGVAPTFTEDARVTDASGTVDPALSSSSAVNIFTSSAGAGGGGGGGGGAPPAPTSSGGAAHEMRAGAGIAMVVVGAMVVL